MVPTVWVSELAILLACDTGERLRREKFPAFANLYRDSRENFVTARASNYFFARIPFAWLLRLRDLAE